jgi:hypothetical protein
MRLIKHPDAANRPYGQKYVTINQAIEEGWYEFSSVRAFQVIDKTFSEAVMNPINGKYYTSRQKYEADVKAAGGRIVGNDIPTHEGYKIHETRPDDGVLDASYRR